jgi:hypothetical protein
MFFELMDSPEQVETPQNAMSSLKAAARIVEFEETVDAREALVSAARSVAADQGLSEDEPILDSLPNKSTNQGPILSNEPTIKKNRRQSVNEDAQQFLQLMKANPAVEKKTETKVIERQPTIEDDAQALVDNIDTEEFIAQIEPVKRKPVNAKYLRTLERKRNERNQEQRRSTHKSIDTELSQVSKMLKESDGTRWGDNISQHAFQSPNQEMLMRTMQRASQTSKSSHKFKGLKQEEIARLSAPQKSKTIALDWEDILSAKKRREKEKRFSTFDNEKNCRFQPVTNETRKKKASSSDRNSDDDEADAKAANSALNFIYRQEAKERTRSEKREFKKGKEDYEARMDKKYCPKCGAKQSYDEVKEKRKLCPNCNVEYKHKTAWGNVEKSFFKRQNEIYEKAQASKEKLAQSLLESEFKATRTRYDHVSGKIIESEYLAHAASRDCDNAEDRLVWTKEVEIDFFTREKERLDMKNEKLKKIEEEIYGTRKNGAGDPPLGGDWRQLSSTSMTSRGSNRKTNAGFISTTGASRSQQSRASSVRDDEWLVYQGR